MKQKHVIQGFTFMLLLMTFTSLLHFTTWGQMLIVMGAILLFIFSCLVAMNYYYVYHIYIMRRFDKWHGKEFTADICGIKVQGKVSIQEIKEARLVYLCHDNDNELLNCNYKDVDGLGYNYMWFAGVGDKESMKHSGIENLKIKIK